MLKSVQRELDRLEGIVSQKIKRTNSKFDRELSRIKGNLKVLTKLLQVPNISKLLIYQN
jgi:phage host-nuclease inhibitor protein Gam